MSRFRKNIQMPFILLFCMAVSMLNGCGGSIGSAGHGLEEMQRKADTLMMQGDYQRAMNAYIDILKEAENADNDTVMALALNKIGTIYAYHDDDRKALHYYERSYGVSEDIRDTLGMYRNVANLIMICKVLGDKARETKYTEVYKGLGIHGNLEYQYNLQYINFLNSIEGGRDEEAGRLMDEMSEFIDEHDYGDDNKAILYNHLGLRYAEKEEYDSAMRCYRKAAAILDSSSLYSNRQAVYGNMCDLFKRMGEQDSLTFYRGKMVESTDSVFNLSNFSNVKSQLDSYEREMAEQRMKTERTRVRLVSALVVAMLGILVVILIYSRKINNARLTMVRLNETLLNENNRLRLELESLVSDKRTREMAGPSDENIKENMPMADTESQEGDSEEGQVKKQVISEDLLQRLTAEILDIMNDRKSVFNPDYNLSMLALQLGTNTRYVSEAIRSLGYSNFRNFINEFRVREGSRRLSDRVNYGNLTIAAIAEGVGFNSDNSFIVAFKKTMGMTPAKYRRLASDVKSGDE